MNERKNHIMQKPNKVLLAMLPFWTPQIPPMGLSCLKSFLKQSGYEVKTVDLNTELELRRGYDNYFATLKAMIPGDKRGNFSSVGNEVWQNHMMAHLHYENQGEYIQLVKILVAKTFFCEVDDFQVHRLNEAIREIYEQLKVYFLALLEREKPTILGISVFIGTLPTSLFAFKVAKEKYPHIMTVMGGGVFYDQLGEGTANLDFFLEKTKPYIDKVVIGEGEILFLKLLQGKLPGWQRVYTNKDIEGEMVDILLTPLPDISDFEIRHYPYIGAYTSRSCPFQCHFCSDPVLWGKYRKKSARQVVDELTYLYNKYGIQLFIMSDLLLNPIATELAQEFIKTDLSIYWDGHLRVGKEVCDVEKTMLWRRGGYYRAELGVESGSQEVLDLMDKRITVEQSRAAVSALAHAGIKTTTYWVIGYPGESEQDFRMTLDLLEEMKDDIYEAMANPFWYYPVGQVKSGQWRKHSIPLYPETARDMLILQQWVLDLEPSREERYQRLNRFVARCKELGIPDIFSLQEIYEADERWRKLHKNAVPPLVKFKREGAYINENKHIRQLQYASVKKTARHDGNWGF